MHSRCLKIALACSFALAAPAAAASSSSRLRSAAREKLGWRAVSRKAFNCREVTFILVAVCFNSPAATADRPPQIV